MAIHRRAVLRGLASASAVPLIGEAFGKGLHVFQEEVEILITPVSRRTVRITIAPIREGKPAPVRGDGSLVQASWGPPAVRLRGNFTAQKVVAGGLTIGITPQPLSFAVGEGGSDPVERFTVDANTGSLSFTTGNAALLGLGQGGPQFDRRGSTDRMRSGQGGYRLRTHGGRVPVPWLIGASGWAVFIHQPYGTFDFTGPESRFVRGDGRDALPLDFFVTVSKDPVEIMAEYCRLTGKPEMPPLWSLGYQQSHRTLASREEILNEAKTFREKKLPCDTLIYLGTGFCPSGWNTANGSFSFNRNVFPDPKAMIDLLHADHFKFVPHIVILPRTLRGSARDACEPAKFDEEEAGCHWSAHRKLFSLGVDGWWPDEGDPLDAASRLTRNRMYWEGPQIDRPNERPFALHRNGHAGMQRYASFLWSGDVYSTWETLRTHVPVAVNTGLSGIPYWGTDIGGFVPTKEFTGELYVRWFQFGAFCPLFRSHGRTWKLRLPWGWNTGELGPNEISSYGEAANPDPSELRNAQVEPICRKYLELRYRLLPYLYSAIRETSVTGLPVMRALWLHYPDDAVAGTRGDEYLWGRDILVAPVTEKGAKERRLYLPGGAWYDFWTGERHEGGREISREVDLATMPLFVRAGAILPLGPVKQYTGEKSDEPLEVRIYPGVDGGCMLYEDDGISFDYRKGAWMGILMSWKQEDRTLTMRLAPGSRLLPPGQRKFKVVEVPGGVEKGAVFAGRPLSIRL